MTVMADKGGTSGARSGRERIQKLAQAALNADVTVDQVDAVLVGLGETLEDLNNSTGNLDATLERFNDTISRINELAPRLIAVVDRLEAIVERVEHIVGIGEAVMAPLAPPNRRCAVRSTRCAEPPGSSAGLASRLPRLPVAEGTGLPWDVPVDDAVGAIAAARARHGDTFVVNSGGDHYLFTFSPTGVESFYALPEEQASKGVADYLMLRRKLPDEIFVGRRVLPNSLFRRDDVASYLANLHWALNQTVAELGSAGSVDLFDLTRRLGHRMGLASWAGPGSAEGDAFERLVSAFDTLDGSDAFVHPDAMAAVAASDKRAERSALEEVAAVVETAVHRLDSGDSGRHRAVRPNRRGLVVGVGGGPDARNRHGRRADPHRLDVQSDGRARLGDGRPARAPGRTRRVVGGDGELAQRCALESTRLAQRSIMSRAVLAPVDLDTGEVTYRVPPAGPSPHCCRC